ncbi:four-carbon acid sugar kinase family protein [Paenibacillus periandrae]|uniref:four-carbon acid sugar kinase family protein n=1 Tax=Paenibacillus periandrae TaxID=1761741 RepID=UPI001F096A15|nr:four-carbon acid sugar kinase family protein [Paenibacillus periandrae]
MTAPPLLMAFYGDDFTGSTDAMEVLEGQGVKSVLFIQPPTNDMLKVFSHVQCIGVAGTARTMSPAAMDKDLSLILHQLKQLNAQVLHYKMCSTADSSPEIGSIGKVVELGKEMYREQAAVPILVAAPQLQRYTVYGNHFAAFQGDVYRLDRHPSMSRHPVTPMKEADLLRHFSLQMKGTISLFSLTDLELAADERTARWESLLQKEKNTLLLDSVHEGHTDAIGQLIGEAAEQQPMFIIGSSGMSLALGSYWKARYSLENREEPDLEQQQTLVLSGSCSPVTNIQIDQAIEHGFRKIKVDALHWLEASESEDVCNRILQEAKQLWAEGRSLILYTADGPEDGSIRLLHDKLSRQGVPISSTGELIGRKLGELGKRLAEMLGIRRVVVAGGDTSGFAALSMGIEALELLQRTAPGAPLCRGYSKDPVINGIQIALKGGQLGQPDYFMRVAVGRSGF